MMMIEKLESCPNDCPSRPSDTWNYDAQRCEACGYSAFEPSRRDEVDMSMVYESGKPDYCYDADEWESTYPWKDRQELFHSMAPGDFMELGLLKQLPGLFVVCVYEENGGGFGEKFFSSAVEAKAEAARQRERFQNDGEDR